VYPARGADKTAVLIVPNVKVKIEAKYSIYILSLHTVLQGSFTFTVA